MLLEPSRPKTKWRWIVIGHGILYALLVVAIIVGDAYFYNAGDAAIVYVTAALLTIFSYVINRMHLPKRAMLLTLFISPGVLLVFFIIMINLFILLGIVH